MKNQANQFKSEVRMQFRKANKLMRTAIHSRTNPLGIPEYAEMYFTQYINTLPQKIQDYFVNAYGEGVEASQKRYNRPICRGRDGQLYSAYDMDVAMMGG